MRLARSFVCTVSGTALLALASGCSGAGNSTPGAPASVAGSQIQAATRAVGPSARQTRRFPSVRLPGAPRVPAPDLSSGFAEPDAARKAKLIVSDDLANTVSAYTQAGKLTAKITGLFAPQGLASDTTGRIYIANTSSSNVLIYKNDYRTHIITLNDPNEYPVDVDVYEAANLVGVTNIYTTGQTDGSVSFYSVAKPKLGDGYRFIERPCVTVSDPNWFEIFFGAFDKSGNFFIDGLDVAGNTIVGVVKGGCSATAIATLTTSNTLGYPGGVELTNAGNVAIDDQRAATVFTYAAKLSGSLGTPIASTPLTGAADPVTFSITKSGNVAWVADATDADVFDVNYPAGGSGPRAPITGLSEPIGVVLAPSF